MVVHHGIRSKPARHVPLPPPAAAQRCCGEYSNMHACVPVAPPAVMQFSFIGPHGSCEDPLSAAPDAEAADDGVCLPWLEEDRDASPSRPPPSPEEFDRCLRDVARSTLEEAIHDLST